MNRTGPAGRFSNAAYSNLDPHGTYKANDQTTALPKTLHCVFCNEDKQLDAFTKSQIAKVTYNPWAPPSYNKKQKTVCCKKCTAKQTQKLTCASCTRTKPLESFAKNQRRNAHMARCLKCMKKREEEDVHDSEPDDDSESEGSENETWDDWLHA
ncbi:hypothetical protein BCR43DRAFT_494690 [Syncephalastrum racemosum]|uniref:Stc1 domain-containing protein n=1 Tax=Syncephalastrum racemosum TaxID=13706 RepID=A0A1X2H8F2_SYNRA|nr:hypothetical protein BCR43DRAFT_494690 [Syncephalastrum racemosum]